MVIIRTTDSRHIGETIPVVNTGDIVPLGDFIFEVQSMRLLENGHWLLSNPNYQIECEE